MPLPSVCTPAKPALTLTKRLYQHRHKSLRTVLLAGKQFLRESLGALSKRNAKMVRLDAFGYATKKVRLLLCSLAVCG